MPRRRARTAPRTASSPAAERAMARHRFHCSLRWSDMDAYGHVNNTTFFTYLEEARVDLLFVHAGEEVARERLSSGIVVARHEIDYKAPLVFRPEPVPIDVWVSRLGNSSFTVALRDPRRRRAGVRRGRDRPGPVRRRRRASPPGVGRGARGARAVPRGVMTARRARRRGRADRASCSTSSGWSPSTTGLPCGCRPAGTVLGRLERATLRGGGAATGRAGAPRCSWTSPCRPSGCSSGSRKASSVELPAAVSGPTLGGAAAAA